CQFIILPQVVSILFGKPYQPGMHKIYIGLIFMKCSLMAHAFLVPCCFQFSAAKAMRFLPQAAPPFSQFFLQYFNGGMGNIFYGMQANSAQAQFGLPAYAINFF